MFLINQAFDVRASGDEFRHVNAAGRAVQKFYQGGIRCEHQKVPIIVTTPECNAAGAACRANATIVGNKPSVCGKRAGFPHLDVRGLHYGKPPDGEFANPCFTVDDQVAFVGLVSGRGK